MTNPLPTNPAPPGGQQFPADQQFPTSQQFPAGQPHTGQPHTGQQPAVGQPFQSGHFAPVPTGPAPIAPPGASTRQVALLPMLSAILLVVAGGLAIGGSFGKLEEEAELAGGQSLTLTYTSWRLTQGGSYSEAIYFHAPHFGIPLVATGALAVLGGLLLVLGRGTLATLARPVAVGAAGLVVGTVWTVGLVVSADLDAATTNSDFQLTWTSGPGFWLLLAGGIAAVVGGGIALFTGRHTARDDTPTPRYGFPAIQGMPTTPGHGAPFVPPPAQQVDPLGGRPIGPPFQPPTPPSAGPANPT